MIFLYTASIIVAFTIVILIFVTWGWFCDWMAKRLKIHSLWGTVFFGLSLIVPAAVYLAHSIDEYKTKPKVVIPACEC